MAVMNESALRARIQSHPDDHAAWQALGLAAFNRGDLPLAIQCLEAAIAVNDQVALYHRNLGELYRRAGQIGKSVAAGRRAVRLAPGDVDAHYNLGLAYTDAKDYRQAIACYRRALELHPRHNLSWNNLGSALEQLGDKEEALAAYEKAIAIDPTHAEAQNNAGAIYSEQGRLDAARAAFEAAIAARPEFVEAHYNLSSLKQYTRDDPHLAMLEGLYARRERLSEHARIRYGFALGKALDDIGEYDRAFSAYEEGNRLQHALRPMEEAREDALVADILRVFDKAFFATRQDWRGKPDPQRTPVFIVGMPRSGTTLLEQILCSHPSVHGAGELRDLSEVVRNATRSDAGRPFTATVAALTQADIERIGSDYLRRVWKLSPQKRYITDKMPANFFYLGLIHLALPHARIIHAMRDPMDSCFSCYTRLFTDTMDFAYDLGTLGRYYRRYMTLMRHWHEVLPPGTILDLSYEEMVADTEGQARRVLEFVGLPWNPACLEFHKNERLVRTASVAQVRKPIYTSSVARWRHFARHLKPLYELVKAFRPADDAERLFAALPATSTRAGRTPAMEAAAGSAPDRHAAAHAWHRQGVDAWQTGRREQAVHLLGRAIAEEGNNAVFHSNLAEMQRQLGRIGEAIHHGERAVALDPSLGLAHSNLGIAYYDAGRYDEAEACHQRAIALEPTRLQSLNNLGSIARARKDLAQAAAWYRQALAVDGDYLEALSNLGAVLVEDDQAEAAEAPLLRALALRADYPEALCNLGLVRIKQGRGEEAVALLRRSLALRPDYPEALIGLGRALHDLERAEEAWPVVERATAVAPKMTDAWCLRGTLAMELEDAAAAEAAYRQAMELAPETGDALVGMGTLRLEEGRIEEAVALFERAVALSDPARPAQSLGARFQLTQAHKVEPGDANLAALEAMAEAAATWSRERRINWHYALGKAYDDLGDYDRAFRNFLEGARLKRATLRYDPDAETARVQRIIEVVDRAFVERLRGAGDPSAVPVFVLGMPRSGTTLTEQIIASHPAVHGAGELRDWLRIVQQQTLDGTRQTFPENLAALTRETAAAWGRDYVLRLRQRAPHAARITDKMPANYLALGLIPLILSGAKIIHVARDPVDTCVSCFTRLFNHHQDATYDLYELGRHYADYARLMAHWRAVLPDGAFLEVAYEDIVADVESQARRLIDWIGLEWDAACLSFHETMRNVRTASVTQVRQPVYRSSVQRWRNYEKFLGPLFLGLGEYAPQGQSTPA